MEQKKYNFTRDELIKEIENKTELGNKIVEMEMTYIRWMASGELYKSMRDRK